MHMLSPSHLFIGIIFVVLGVILLRYNFKLVGYTGHQAWIEDHLGYGTTYLAYQVLAIVVLISGLLYATGLGNGVLDWLLTPFTNMLSGLRGK